MSYQLGVDLGTSFTAAAIARDGRTDVVSLGTRALEIPSVAFLEPGGTLVVGEVAVRRGASDPTRVVRDFKRRLGDPAPILLAGSPYSAEALMAALLRAAVGEVVAREGEWPSHLVLTHPANWGPYKRELFGHVPALADVAPVSMTTEPEAAAINFASTTRVAVGEVIAVYDLGGGTFDAAVLRKTATGFETLGTPEGVEHLGGADFDDAVVGYVQRSLGAAWRELDRNDPATRAALLRLRRECTDAKEHLSVDTEVAIPVMVPGLQTQVRLTRAEFEDLIRPALTATIEALRRALRSAQVEPGAVKTTVLAGGSSRIPLIAELVRSGLGLSVAVGTHPKHAVAVGAAQLAAERASAATGPGPAPSVIAPLPPAPSAPEPSGPPPPASLPPSGPSPPSSPPPAGPEPEPGPEPAALMVPEADDKPSRRPVVLAGIAVAVVALVVVLVAAALGRDGGEEAGGSTVTTLGSTTAPDTTGPPASTTDATVATTPRVTATTAPPGVTCEPTKLALLTQLSGGEHDWDLIVDAAEFAVDEFNADNPNCSVTLDVRNSEESAELAATQADDLRNDDQVLGAVAVYLSDQVATAGSALNHLRIPFIVSQAKRATLNDEGLPTFNRVVGDEYAPADGAAAYLRDTLEAERVYVVDDGQAALADRLAENLGDLVVGRSEVAPDQQDFTAVVDDVFADAADTVYYGGSYQQGGLLVSALRGRGFEGTFMMPETLNEARLSETAGGAAEGALLTCNCAPVDRPQAFVTAFRAATGSNPKAYVPETYDATRILLAGIEAGVTDREGMIDFVRSYEGRGVTGTIAFDDRGELVGDRSYLYRVETGSAAYTDSLP